MTLSKRKIDHTIQRRREIMGFCACCETRIFKDEIVNKDYFKMANNELVCRDCMDDMMKCQQCGHNQAYCNDCV